MPTLNNDTLRPPFTLASTRMRARQIREMTVKRPWRLSLDQTWRDRASRTSPPALQPLIRHDGVTDRRRKECALFSAGSRRPRRALHRHPRLHRDQLRGLRDGRHAVLPAHPQPAPPADLLRRPRSRNHGVLERVLKRGQWAVNFRLIAEARAGDHGPDLASWLGSRGPPGNRRASRSSGRRCRCLHRPLRLLPAGATVAGRDSHPLRNGALSRRTE